MAPAPLSKRTLPLNSTLWNGQGPLKPAAPAERTVRSPHRVHEFLAVTGGTRALSNLIVHSMASALSVVVQSQRHHQPGLAGPLHGLRDLDDRELFETVTEVERQLDELAQASPG